MNSQTIYKRHYLKDWTLKSTRLIVHSCDYCPKSTWITFVTSKVNWFKHFSCRWYTEAQAHKKNSGWESTRHWDWKQWEYRRQKVGWLKFFNAANNLLHTVFLFNLPGGKLIFICPWASHNSLSRITVLTVKKSTNYS